MHPVLCKFITKAVDFDSAVPQGVKIFGYTPKCMPPELARTLKNNGSFDDFTASPKYDMWSLGMLVSGLQVQPQCRQCSRTIHCLTCYVL
jgi:hypothetical protein